MRGLPVVLLDDLRSTGLRRRMPGGLQPRCPSALRSARSCRGAAQTYKACTQATTQGCPVCGGGSGKVRERFCRSSHAEAARLLSTLDTPVRAEVCSGDRNHVPLLRGILPCECSASVRSRAFDHLLR